MTVAGDIAGVRPAWRWRPSRILKRQHHPLAIAFVLVVAALVLAPIVSLVQLALRGDPDIWAHLTAFVLPAALKDTALLLAGVAVIAGATGIGAAWLVTAYRFPGRDSFRWLLPLPLAIPTYIVAYVYVDVFDPLGPVQAGLRALFGWRSAADYWFPDVRSLGGAIFVIGFVLYPYVYLAARAMFQTQSAALIEVARTLGATRFMLARHVALPLARPALAVGLSLALLETLNDIGASEYLGVRTLTLTIFTTWLNRGSLPGAAQIACVMLLVIAALIALERHGRRDRRFSTSVRQPRVAVPIRLTGWARWAATLCCFAPVAFGFLIPAGFLLREVIVRGLVVGFDHALIGHTLTTVSLAAIATALALVLGLGAAIAARLARRRIALWGMSLASLGYAVPGTVLALGLLSPLVAVDEAINWLTQHVAGVGVGLLLAGSGAALVIAYAIRFLAIATGSAQVGLGRIATEIDDVARTLGCKPARLAWLIHLPLARPALGGAALLIFVDCLKELPATLLLRPLNVETLSTYIYQFATRGNFEEGALAALLIVLVGLLPVIRIVRFADTEPPPEAVAG